MVSKSATQAETKIASTTASPASFSPAAERSRNAMPSGTAVSASPKLWIRSASSATDPETAKMAACRAAVRPRTARLIETVRMPARERMMERSTSPCEWPWPWSWP